MALNIKEKLSNQIGSAYLPIDQQIRVIQRLIWGVLILTILGAIVTLLVSKVVTVIITVSVFLIVICSVALTLIRIKRVVFSTILMSLSLHIAIITVILPQGIANSTIVIVSFVIPLILLSYMWGRFGAFISLAMTAISFSILSVFEELGLTGWAKQETVVWVDLWLQFMIFGIIAAVIIQSQSSIVATNQRLLKTQQQLRSFTAGIVHDFGTPIQRLYAQIANVDEQKRHLVKEQLDLMSALIEQTRTFLEVQDGDRLQLRQDVVSIISVAANAMASAASSQALHRHIHFELDCPAPLRSQFVLGDATAIRRIVDNLLKNALGVANPDSTIVIRIQAVDQYLELAVIDEGPGIPEEDQPYVFEPYWTSSNGTQHTGTGWGIGLAVVRQLTTAMGGDCGVTSVPGSGSTFWIRLQQCEPSS